MATWKERLDEQNNIQKAYKPNGKPEVKVQINLSKDNWEFVRVMYENYKITPDELINRLLGNSINYVNGSYPTKKEGK